MYFKECPDCGAHLDPGERCDCREAKREDAPDAAGTPSEINSTVSVSNSHADVNACLRLKAVRQQAGVMAKDAALVVRDVFPKFNRQLLAQCEAWEKYGVIIHPKGLDAICKAYNLPLPAIPITVENTGTKKTENRRLARKVTFRMTPSDFDVLQKRVQEDGFDTVQAWLYTKISELLGGGGCDV